MMNVEETGLEDVKLIRAKPLEDNRGLFVTTFEIEEFSSLGIEPNYVQRSISLNRKKGTLRGLHFQTHPHEQAKLIRVSRGKIADVVVDVRSHSKAFGKHIIITLEESDWTILFVPSGFAHGFCTLVDDTEVTYEMSHPYSAQFSRGIIWDDPDLAINWPIDRQSIIISKNEKCC